MVRCVIGSVNAPLVYLEVEVSCGSDVDVGGDGSRAPVDLVGRRGSSVGDFYAMGGDEIFEGVASRVVVRAIEAAVGITVNAKDKGQFLICLLYTSPSPRDRQKSRMPSSA